MLVILLPFSVKAEHHTEDEYAYEEYPDDPDAEDVGIRAEIVARQQVTLAGEMAGKIVHFSLREGDWVQKGEMVAQFRCESEEAQKRRALAVLKSARHKADVNARLIEYRAISKLEHHLATIELERSQAELEVIEAKLRTCFVTAPFSGRVEKAHIRAHHYVRPGDPLVDLINENALEITFVMPSKYLARVAQGKRFRVRIDEMKKRYKAKVKGFGARIDPVSQTIKVFATLVGTSKGLKPGMSGRVEMKSLIKKREQPY
ncbi:MAG: efflux RND transporter periplasmic adaptor subunit [Magnetococcales bacterium]|nr:efflux RND transporter periplasmic adaptor subunit [Magnetococcales bacterium]